LCTKKNSVCSSHGAAVRLVLGARQLRQPFLLAISVVHVEQQMRFTFAMRLPEGVDDVAECMFVDIPAAFVAKNVAAAFAVGQEGRACIAASPL
jgi:hypothetical protein